MGGQTWLEEDWQMAPAPAAAAAEAAEATAAGAGASAGAQSFTQHNKMYSIQAKCSSPTCMPSPPHTLTFPFSFPSFRPSQEPPVQPHGNIPLTCRQPPLRLNVRRLRGLLPHHHLHLNLGRVVLVLAGQDLQHRGRAGGLRGLRGGGNLQSSVWKEGEKRARQAAQQFRFSSLPHPHYRSSRTTIFWQLSGSGTAPASTWYIMYAVPACTVVE